MSIPVDLARLSEQVGAFGTTAFLVTTALDGPPHVASVVVAYENDALVMGAGRRTRENALQHPAVALLWPPGADDDHCLIVDGIARPADAASETLVVEPTAAVLHRRAGAP